MTYRTPPKKYGKRVAPVLGWMEAHAALNAWRQAGGRLRYTLCAEAAEGEKAQGKGKKKLQTEEMRGIIHNRLICFIKLQKGLRP